MRKPKIVVPTLIVTLNIIFSGTIFLCHAAEQYPAMVEDISGDRYLPAVKEALGKAGKSIDMVMYLTNFDPKSRDSAVNQLVDELVKAHDRGVKVRVIMDQNIPAGWANDAFFLYLKQKGIDVFYDDIYTVTHSKLIVIDRETAIVGSTNWTDPALSRNEEASILVRSKELAEQCLADISRIKIDQRASILDDENTPAIRISDTFLLSPELVPRMIRSMDSNAIDLYLLLLRKFDGNAEGRVDIDYGTIANDLGLNDKLNKKSRRTNIERALNRLEKKYNLIKIVSRAPKAPYCLLLDIQTGKPYTLLQDKYFRLPDTYWQYGWNKALSGTEKVCLLVSCYKAQSRGRVWSGYIPGLMQEFHLSNNCLSNGMSGLRRLNIIEIEYAPFSEDGGFLNRGPTLFRYLGLYSPEALQNQKQQLADLYGKERIDTAEKYAKIVFKDKDARVIEEIIKLMDEYGPEEVRYAFEKVSRWESGNPKRTFNYVIGILRSPENKGDGSILPD